MSKKSSVLAEVDKINFRLLHYFRVVAQELSFSRAALRLNMSQPPLSMHIKELEQRLETRLFIRTTRSVELTLAGRTLLRNVEAILDQANDALLQVQQLGRGEVGHLVVGTVGTAAWGGLLPVLRRFTQQIPEVSWSLEELNPARQVEALQQRRIDVGVVRDMYNTLPMNMTTQLLAHENIVLAVPQHHPLAQQGQVPLSVLQSEPFILLFAQQSRLGTYLYAICREHHFTPNVVQQVNEPQTALALVAEGYGITLLPECYVQMTWPGIHFCQVTPRIPADLYVIYDPQSVTPVAQALIDMLKQEKGSAPVQ